MRTRRPIPRSRAAFTMVEIMISTTIVALTLALALNTFMVCTKMIYKDNQRLATNTTLRYFMAQVAKATLDASEFYIYPNYQTLDGSVSSLGDLTTAVTDSWGIDLYHGDCLVLVTRTSLDTGSAIRQVSIYYRVSTNTSVEGGIRYYEGTDYGTTGTSQTLDALLSTINLKNTPAYPGSKLLAARSIGRLKSDGSNTRYPIFSSGAPQLTTENENVSINCEVINGSTGNNVLSSSSFNYTISPRR